MYVSVYVRYVIDGPGFYAHAKMASFPASLRDMYHVYDIEYQSLIPYVKLWMHIVSIN